MHRSTIRRFVLFTTGAAFGLNLFTGAAFAAPPTTPPNSDSATPAEAKYECHESHHSNTDHGANNDDGYQSTCDEADFGGNGQEFGPGLQTGKPCAGCVGNADDKNPPGQYPDGSDSNSGYECDGRDRPARNQQGNGNHGIGDENPAHTGCESSVGGVVTEPPAPTCPDGSAMPTTDVNGDSVIDSGDCHQPGPPPAHTCPDGSAMPSTDVDGNGVINAADCHEHTPPPAPVVEEPVVVTTEVTAVVSPVVVTPVVAGVAVDNTPAPVTNPIVELARPQFASVLGTQFERAEAPAAPAAAAALARTGVNSGLLAMFAIGLAAIGFVLVASANWKRTPRT